jgi:two-component system, chemotaxis family, protein-glutamate methylesterase/glutaminase
MKGGYDIIVIGGSAGSLSVISSILDALPASMQIPVVIVVHRLKNVESEMGRLLSTNKFIGEPEDKEPVREGHLYLAPQNYHLMLEEDRTFMLDYSELVNYSRPSIDMTFSSVADVYGPRSLGILLSGANKDGAAGLCQMMASGATGIIQDPETASFDVMPRSAMDMCRDAKVLSIEEIIKFIIFET